MIISFLRKKVNAYFLQPELFWELKNFYSYEKPPASLNADSFNRESFMMMNFLYGLTPVTGYGISIGSLPPLNLFFITAYARFRTLCVFSAGAGFFASFAVTARTGGTVASAATVPRNFFPHGESYYCGDDYRRRDYYYNFRNHGIPPAFMPRLSDGGTNRTFCLLSQSR